MSILPHSRLQWRFRDKGLENGIAILLNTIATTGKYPAGIKSGTLAPIPKPGKKQGPPAHFRPIILLYIIRKILAICLIRICWDRVSTRIPIAQSAYQSGPSTTELVFAINMLVENAITSSTYNIHLLLLDMSKAFDTVCRNKLTDLKEVLEPDEMHIMAILISDVVLTVKVGKESGEQFKTEVGIAQGDCLSAVLFIFYLAKSLTPNRECIEYNYASVEQCGNILPEECNVHDYFRKTETKNYFEVDPKYADDISWATTAKQRITYIKEITPSTLAKRNLVINESKTEEDEIIRQGSGRNASYWGVC